MTSFKVTPKWVYDVFLSFRGEDTRNNFTGHLYVALNQKGVYTFKDDKRLEKGKSISPELLTAIEQSRFAIIIFSKNYASSSWCLDEVAKIMECKRKIGMTVFPVFYHVPRSVVLNQEESFAEDFAKHEMRYKNEPEKVQRWRNALRGAASESVMGWDLSNTGNVDEAECIQLIVERVSSAIDPRFMVFEKYLVGIESRMQRVDSVLKVGLSDVRFLGIFGMGGIGKTTLARVIFEKHSNQFEGACFLANVRETSEKHGLERLQEILIAKTLKLTSETISTVDEGVALIMLRHRFKKVLIVLDDVNHRSQLNALARSHNWFGPGSRIIITTREKHLLIQHKVDRFYKVNVLNENEALELFSWHAFEEKLPPKRYEELARHVVQYASGLPLALEVLGSFLNGQGMKDWRSTIGRLRDAPDGEIQEKLQISYDALHQSEKRIFLDIACFFKGKKKHNVIRVLNSFGFHPHIGMSVLIQKSLIFVSQQRIQMHDVLQEMAWQIVRHVSPGQPGKYSRLWLPDDTCPVLVQRMGTDAVEGIVLRFSTSKDVNISAEAFRNMTRLRLLKIHNVFCHHGPEFLASELVWLTWHGYPLKCLPSNFEAKKLFSLKMRHSRIIQLWKGIKNFEELTIINLSHSQKLIRTPDFTGTPNLEKLILENCTSLVEVHPSIGVLKKLILLNLKFCKSLKELPESIQMESLEDLILTGCSKLERFPENQGNMNCLLELRLERCPLGEIPSSIGLFSSLRLLDLSHCEHLQSLPSSICRLKYLKSLILSGCSKLESLPENLGGMENLEVLYADETAITQPPSSIHLLKNLKILSFRQCKGTEEYEAASSLILPSLSSLRSLRKLDISYCNLFDGSIPQDLSAIPALEELNLSGNFFIHLPASISHASQLKILELVDCTSLETLMTLPSGIAELYADNCFKLNSLPPLSNKYKKLRTVSFANCLGLYDKQEDETVSAMMQQNLLQFLSDFQLQGISQTGKRFSILFPGRDIPSWFSHQIVGPSITVNLPPNWHNDNFLGFAICGVSHTIHAKLATSFSHLREIGNIRVFVRLVFRDNKDIQFVANLCSCVAGREDRISADHLCFGYVRLDTFYVSFRKLHKSPNDCHLLEVSSNRRPMEGELGIKKWGIRLLYKNDVAQEEHKDQTVMMTYSSASEVITNDD